MTAESRPPLRARLMASPYVAFWSTALVVCGIAGHRTSVLLHRAFSPSGDAAVNSLLVIRAEHLQQLGRHQRPSAGGS